MGSIDPVNPVYIYNGNSTRAPSPINEGMLRDQRGVIAVILAILLPRR